MYTPIVVDHFTHPRNVGQVDDADGIGQVDDPATDTIVSISIKLDGRRIDAARFRTLGCSACVAASSLATELVRGRTLADASRLDRAAILEALGGLPPEMAYCTDLVARALGEAIAMADGPSPR